MLHLVVCTLRKYHGYLFTYYTFISLLVLVDMRNAVFWVNT